MLETVLPEETLPTMSLQSVRARLRRACNDFGRSHDDVTLICVSKGFGREDVIPVIAAGERVFAENRVQEAAEKWPDLISRYPDVRLDLIGPLQSNKADAAVALFNVIQTIDRPKIALALSASIKKIGKTPKFYIQVNTGEESQKAGVLPRDLGQLLCFCRSEARLEIAGLMCIPPVDQLASPHFALLNRLANEFELPELSMGMSADFDLAVQMGATQVRVGSAIFGNRRRFSAPIKI